MYKKVYRVLAKDWKDLGNDLTIQDAIVIAKQHPGSFIESYLKLKD